MTFPGAGAHVYYNEAGEPLGWDYPDYDSPPDPDNDREDERYDPAYYEDPDPDKENEQMSKLKPTDPMESAAYMKALAIFFKKDHVILPIVSGMIEELGPADAWEFLRQLLCNAELIAEKASGHKGLN